MSEIPLPSNAVLLTPKERARLMRHYGRMQEFERKAAEEKQVMDEISATIGERAGSSAINFSIDAAFRALIPVPLPE